MMNAFQSLQKETEMNSNSSTGEAPNTNKNSNTSKNSSASENSNNALVAINAGELISAADASDKPFSVPVPFQNSIVLIENTRIAGTMHIRNIESAVENIKVGSNLRLEREKGNITDMWAIKVFAGKDHIGYVSADCNEILARLMDAGKSLTAKLANKERAGMWHKLYMEICLDD